VLVGIIDDGFELRHPDFWKADSSTRVAFLWDQTQFVPNYPESIVGYGATWSAAQINAGACTQIPKDHGTHVAGIAAGNGRAANKFVGVAPESELLYVKMDENSPAFLSNFVDALYWMGRKSTALGKPCAVNSSVGTYFGSHDGERPAYGADRGDFGRTQGLGFGASCWKCSPIPFPFGGKSSK
jgi:subtilisin family serine protease